MAQQPLRMIAYKVFHTEDGHVLNTDGAVLVFILSFFKLFSIRQCWKTIQVVQIDTE